MAKGGDEWRLLIYYGVDLMFSVNRIALAVWYSSRADSVATHGKMCHMSDPVVRGGNQRDFCDLSAAIDLAMTCTSVDLAFQWVRWLGERDELV